MILLFWESLLGSVVASDPVQLDLERRFSQTVYPFLEAYCFGCHGQEKQKGKLDLSPYSSVEMVTRDYRLWEIVLERLKANEMPPEEAKAHPTSVARQSVIEWIQALRRHEADRNAGDPGPVLARRLSNAEYDHTIRDLTGVDLRPTREFPVDPANEAGFVNSGESLAMSPALLGKYLEAARLISEHVVLKPRGFVFAPHPAVTETDRDNYCVTRIVDFYRRQPTNYADYFLAAWRYQHRAALDKPQSTLVEVAGQGRVSPKYLATVWATLTDSKDDLGPLATLRHMWRDLPAPLGKDEDTARGGCERMRDFVVNLRQRLKPKVTNLKVRGIAPGSQPLVLWKDREYAANRTRYDPGALAPSTDSQTPDQSKPATAAEPGLLAPSDPAARQRYEAALKRFCEVFPDAFYISERGRVFLEKDEGDRGRLLSAGFHLMVGYFRDDAPLYELILDEKERRELDALWAELNFIALAPMRQYKDFIFFERAEPPRFMQQAEFDFARSEDKDAISAAKMAQLAEAYVAKARRNEAPDAALAAIDQYFKTIAADIRQIERDRAAAEPSHLEALRAFAERAYRRPLSLAEREDLLGFYRSLREKNGLDHEEAMRDSVVSVLMSPDFCYRIELGGAVGRLPGSAGISAGALSGVEFAGKDGGAPRAGEGEHRPAVTGTSDSKAVRWKSQPLPDYALASRLSYFLWASLPDETLLAGAAAGDLHRPEVLLAQSRRLMGDARIRGLATEFAGHWLDFRRFEEHNAVDRERFKTFNNELRQAMFEEPIRFFVDLVQGNRSVLDLLYANHTFLNPALARHYGIPFPGSVGVPPAHERISPRSEVRAGETPALPGANDWTRIDDADQHGRGGLLPMAVFLTQNAPGLRTSPVKRGYWVVRRLLGEYIPAPPPKVPELPQDESKLGDLTLRETLARHRAGKSCAPCHERFDSFGLVFENYGPIGERRARDLAGHPVDTRATFPDGSEGSGLDGLRRYLRDHRQDDFLDELCRKLLAYSLGRSLQLSDDSTIREMRAKLAANDYRFSSLVESIVTSPQFLNQRIQKDVLRK